MEKEILEKAVKECESINAVLTKLGKNTSSGSYKLFNRKIKKYGIDISHFLSSAELSKRRANESKFNKTPIEEMFTENSLIARSNIKRRIIKDDLIKYECALCGQDENWNSKKISLILDHINGINNDNRLENLRFVCPNCNATLDTHCVGHKIFDIKEKKEIKKIKIKEKKRKDRPNTRKVERPSLDILLDSVKEIGYSATGRLYGVSDNAIRKWIKRYNNGLVV